MYRPFKASTDYELLVLLREDNEAAFEEIYRRYFQKLHSLAKRRINNVQHTEDIVHDLFLNLWLNRHKIQIDTLQNYLMRSVKYRVLDELDHQTVKQKFVDYQSFTPQISNNTEENILYSDAMKLYEENLVFLPDKCREVFLLSRNGLSQKEIASQLGISENTVENHIAKALRLLKTRMSEFISPNVIFPVFFFLFEK